MSSPSKQLNPEDEELLALSLSTRRGLPPPAQQPPPRESVPPQPALSPWLNLLQPGIPLPYEELNQEDEQHVALPLPSSASKPPPFSLWQQQQRLIPRISSPDKEVNQEDEELVALPLSSSASGPLPPPPPPPPSHLYMSLPSHRRPTHQGKVGVPLPARGPKKLTFRQGKSETIPAPYPWATTRRATVHSLYVLLSHGIKSITGEVQCKQCERPYEIEYDLQQKFIEVASFISKYNCTMHDRAPAVWMNPSLPNCKFCEKKNCVKPILSKKRSINWLFLLLGQMVGCCKLDQLKYFCKHTKNHRTGAKDRVLYLTYLGLCKQLDPQGPFDL